MRSASASYVVGRDLSLEDTAVFSSIEPVNKYVFHLYKDNGAHLDWIGRDYGLEYDLVEALYVVPVRSTPDPVHLRQL